MLTTVPQPSTSGSSPDLPCLELDSESPLDHGKTVNGDHACCKAVSPGLVDCIACLEDESSSFVANLTEDDKELTLHILATVRLAGSNGVTKDQLLVRHPLP
jgi:oxalate---CoA ligase